MRNLLRNLELLDDENAVDPFTMAQLVRSRSSAEIRADAALPGELWFSPARLLFVFILSRVVLFATIVVSRIGILPGAFWEPGGLLSVLANLDGTAELATSGGEEQGARVGDAEASGAPLGLYESFVRLASLVDGGSGVAAVVLANISLFAASLLLYRLAAFEAKDPRVARAALMLLMFSPLNIFFSAALPQSTYLALAIAAFYAARTNRWLLALFAAACLLLMKSGGWLILVPLVVEYLHQISRQDGFAKRLFSRPRVAWFVFGLLALVALGSLVAFQKEADPGTAWPAVFADLLDRSRAFANYPEFYAVTWRATLAVGVVLVSAGFFLKLRPAYLVYTLLLLAEFIWKRESHLVPAGVTIAFPFYLIAGAFSARFTWVSGPLIACSMALLTFCVILVAGGYWPV